MALGLLTGMIGGYVFYLARLPLPWMLGAMCACLAAALSPLPVGSVRAIRPPFAAVIGVALGSAVTTQTFAHAATWAPITLAVVTSGVTIGTLGFFYLRRVVGLDPVTAYFAAVPAGLYEMTVQGGRRGGDEQWIALIQGLRIFLVVLTVPMGMRLIAGVEMPGSGLPKGYGAGGLTPRDVAVLISCAAIGWPLAVVARLPNPALIGPLLISATAHGLGITSATPPAVMVAGAQVVLGATIGLGFRNATHSMLRRGALHGVILAFAMIALCLTIALGFSLATGVDIRLLILAAAPAGMTEMSLMAFAMGFEVAIVSIHQLMRNLLIQLFAPMIARLLTRRG